MSKRIYAILDKTADAIVGGLQLHAHEAAAVRSFRDIAQDRDTMIARHPADYELICLGELENEDNEKMGLVAHTITATVRPVVVITGAALVAAANTGDAR